MTKDTWFNYSIEKIGLLENRDLLLEAKSFRDSVAAGEVKAAPDPVDGKLPANRLLWRRPRNPLLGSSEGTVIFPCRPLFHFQQGAVNVTSEEDFLPRTSGRRLSAHGTTIRSVRDRT